ncbi:Putative Cobyric acid synthase [Clostridium chauvoei JF4335]|uniref:Cobyric acid synthase n=1 Tax=Clostridium chauvoei JF4335 TaxID=1351755 RepID=A0A1U6JIV2_9CLOT|nr:cobyric acid synthase [Clostridium chauvoei]SLK20264.1 Putative Cobyric acid synthase [Clostridium chauvoei JF4335]
MNKIMFLGTASSVGKSTVATAFCRYFKNEGLKVAPFKDLNISLNSYVTKDGLEMGRAQVVQAEACELEPSAFMNPILLKPSGNMKTQVIVNGKVYCNMDSYKYKELNKKLKGFVKETFYNFSKDYDLMVLEGSGSCAEINLKESDIANMTMAKVADSNVILVADIDRGGVFASVVGTIMLLDEEDRKRIKGIIINKFRGKVEYFKPAMKQLEDIIKIPVLGTLPYFELDIEDEDSVTERIKNKDSMDVDIAVIRLPYMSNFTDFNSLERLEGVSVRYVKEVRDVKTPDILIIPGSKNTISDLRFIKEMGFFDKINDLKENGIIILGICGGYQMLGNSINDIYGVEGEVTLEKGFGYLDIDTIFNKDKITRRVNGKVCLDFIEDSKENFVSGYEIHNGVSIINNNAIPFIKDEKECILGVCNKERNVFGTYLHGVFDEGKLAENLINKIRKEKGISYLTNDMEYSKYKLNEYDKLAALLEENIDMELAKEIIFRS